MPPMQEGFTDISHNANDDQPAMRTNFKNGMRLMGREIEAMFLWQNQKVN